MFKNKKEMWEALLAGNRLVHESGDTLYLDLNDDCYGPIVFKSHRGAKLRAANTLYIHNYTSFSIQGIPKPKQGDKVLVWDNDKSCAVERTYLTTVPNISHPIQTIQYGKKLCLDGLICTVTGFKHMEPLPQTYTITIDGKEITISEESYVALKESLTNGDK